MESAEQDLEKLSTSQLVAKLAIVVCVEQQKAGFPLATQYPTLFVKWFTHTFASDPRLRELGLRSIDREQIRTLRNHCIKRIHDAPPEWPFLEGTVTELSEKGRPYTEHYDYKGDMANTPPTPSDIWEREALAMGKLLVDMQKVSTKDRLDKMAEEADHYRTSETETNGTFRAVVAPMVTQELRRCFFNKDLKLTRDY